MPIHSKKNAKTVYAGDLDDLCLYVFLSRVTVSKLLKHKSCPQKTPKGYDVLAFLVWFLANPALCKADTLAPFREPGLQNRSDDAAIDLKKEQALWTKTKGDREKIRLQRDKNEVVDAGVRDAQELERFIIIKSRLFEAGRINAPELIKAKNLEDMAERFEDALNTSFLAIQKDFNNINTKSKLEEVEPIIEKVDADESEDN